MGNLLLQQITDEPLFIRNINDEITSLITKRSLRPVPPEGKRYVRDWHDRFVEKNRLNAEFFLSEIQAIWEKRSSLSSEERFVIQAVCNRAAIKTMIAQKEVQIKEIDESLQQPKKKRSKKLQDS